MSPAMAVVTDINPQIIAQRLRHIRQERGLSQTHVAGAAGINLGNYNEIEHAKRQSFQVKILYRLCQVLETSADYLLGLTDDPSPHWTRHQAGTLDLQRDTGWAPWIPQHSTDIAHTPYGYRTVEIARPEWATSQSIDPRTLHPTTNVAGLWWRPVPQEVAHGA